MDEGKSVKLSLTRDKWLGVFLAGILVLGLGVFTWITAKQTNPEIEIISQAEDVENTGGGMVTVDVSGAVNEPGLYTLTANSRIEDALKAAGGINEVADWEWLEKNINRADILEDGMKVYIPKKKIEGQMDTSDFAEASSDKCVSLNSASLAQLEDLPGIGPVTAEKIVDGRPYSKIEDLKEKKIVGEKVYGEIEAKICLW